MTTNAFDRCYRCFLDAVRRFALLRRGERVLVGLSGGADSLGLLHFLLEYRRQEDADLVVAAAHLNHGLRGAAADADEEFVRGVTADLGVPCHCARVDVAALGGGIEETARRERFAFLETIAAQTAATAVALGHHADDNIETVLFRLRRGTHLRGMAGILPARPLAPGSDVRLVHPLLFCRRAAIRDALRERGIAWREDASNRSPAHARNQIRHDLLPRLEALAPGFGDDLLAAVDELRALRGVIEEQAAAALTQPGVILGVDHASWPLETVLPAPVREEALWQLMTRLGVPMGRMTAAHFRNLEQLRRRPEDTGWADLPGGWRAERRRGGLAFFRRDAYHLGSAESATLSAPGTTALPELGVEVAAEVVEGDTERFQRLRRTKAPNEEWLDNARCPRPLAVRAWRPGDRFWPLGAPGERKVQDILTDAKVPRSERGRVAVVTAADHAVWLVGHCIDERARVSGRTRRLLHLRWRVPSSQERREEP